MSRHFGKILPLVAAVAVAAGLIEVLTLPTMRPALVAAGVATTAERYTSVEVVEHQTVPATAAAGSLFVFRIAVANHEDRPIAYVVETAVTTGRGRLVAATTPLSLSAGERKELEVSAQLPACTGRVKVAASLAGRSEAVSLWVLVTSGSAAVSACA